MFAKLRRKIRMFLIGRKIHRCQREKAEVFLNESLNIAQKKELLDEIEQREVDLHHRLIDEIV